MLPPFTFTLRIGIHCETAEEAAAVYRQMMLAILALAERVPYKMETSTSGAPTRTEEATPLTAG